MNKKLNLIHQAAGEIEAGGVTDGLAKAESLVGKRTARALLVAILRLTVAPKGTAKRVLMSEDDIRREVEGLLPTNFH
jgi:hypothetical protein